MRISPTPLRFKIDIRRSSESPAANYAKRFALERIYAFSPQKHLFSASNINGMRDMNVAHWFAMFEYVDYAYYKKLAAGVATLHQWPIIPILRNRWLNVLLAKRCGFVWGRSGWSEIGRRRSSATSRSDFAPTGEDIGRIRIFTAEGYLISDSLELE